MPRIEIADLPAIQDLTPEEIEQIFGAGPGRRARLGVESLEGRDLMSVTPLTAVNQIAKDSVKVSIRDHEVLIYGTSTNDSIHVTETGSGISVNASGATRSFAVNGPGELRISVFGLAGDDTIDARFVRTGDVFLYGGTGTDKLVGGQGDDYLIGGTGNDTYDGGPGIDRIFSGNYAWLDGGDVVTTSDGLNRKVIATNIAELAYVSSGDLITRSTSGVVSRSDDALGGNWVTLTKGIRDITIDPQGNLFALEQTSKRLLRSLDATGKNWVVVQTGVNQLMRDHTGAIVTLNENGKVSSTTDAAQTAWKEIDSGIKAMRLEGAVQVQNGPLMNKVLPASLYTVAYTGRVRRTEDSGKTWSVIDNLVDEVFVDKSKLTLLYKNLGAGYKEVTFDSNGVPYAIRASDGVIVRFDAKGAWENVSGRGFRDVAIDKLNNVYGLGAETGVLYKWAPGKGPELVDRFVNSISISSSGELTKAYTTIGLKWQSLRGEAGELGKSLDTFKSFAGGAETYYFEKGAIFWRGSDKVYAVSGDAWGLYKTSSAELGFPISDTKGMFGPGGTYQLFQSGVILQYWNNGIQHTHAVSGAIYQVWTLENQSSQLGFPVGNETNAVGGAGRVQRFENGILYWNKATGHIVSIVGNPKSPVFHGTMYTAKSSGLSLTDDAPPAGFAGPAPDDRVWTLSATSVSSQTCGELSVAIFAFGFCGTDGDNWSTSFGVSAGAPGISVQFGQANGNPSLAFQGSLTTPTAGAGGTTAVSYDVLNMTFQEAAGPTYGVQVRGIGGAIGSKQVTFTQAMVLSAPPTNQPPAPPQSGPSQPQPSNSSSNDSLLGKLEKYLNEHNIGINSKTSSDDEPEGKTVVGNPAPK